MLRSTTLHVIIFLCITLMSGGGQTDAASHDDSTFGGVTIGRMNHDYSIGFMGGYDYPLHNSPHGIGIMGGGTFQFEDWNSIDAAMNREHGYAFSAMVCYSDFHEGSSIFRLGVGFAIGDDSDGRDYVDPALGLSYTHYLGIYDYGPTAINLGVQWMPGDNRVMFTFTPGFLKLGW